MKKQLQAIDIENRIDGMQHDDDHIIYNSQCVCVCVNACVIRMSHQSFVKKLHCNDSREWKKKIYFSSFIYSFIQLGDIESHWLDHSGVHTQFTLCMSASLVFRCSDRTFFQQWLFFFFFVCIFRAVNKKLFQQNHHFFREKDSHSFFHSFFFQSEENNIE